ncbi:helix-turn-helix transcriptional regulator [Mucilaginibacter panaciglaebae]|uniref:HTH cro/C1-type domain-containing protein n=1 Tax=Mucilaginibacter panaciglaebae TaxID=502331 RepID=A0ABP7WNH1_9SPHI
MPQLRDIAAIRLLAENVRKYRIEKNMTMEALANEAGIEYSQISRLERGLLNTSVSVIFAVAKALKIPPSKLLDEIGN